MEQVNTTPTIPKRVLVLRRHLLVLYRVWWLPHYTTGLVGVIVGAAAGIAATKEDAR
jgi:hypothetical protein